MDRSTEVDLAWETLGLNEFRKRGWGGGVDIQDEDIVFAYHTRASKPLRDKRLAKKALESLAYIRDSAFLSFALLLSEHLTDDSVNEWADMYPFPTNKGHHLLNGEMTSSTSDLGQRAPAAHATPDVPSSASGGIRSSESAGWSSSPSIQSESLESELSDLHRSQWRCSECNAELVDSNCLNGHFPMPCDECGERFNSKRCSYCHARLCELCVGDIEKDRVCTFCEYEASDDGSQESDEEDTAIYFDEVDGVWRCTGCSWEVELHAENTGSCQCQPDVHNDIQIDDMQFDDMTSSPGLVDKASLLSANRNHGRFIDLSAFPDYEAAYCSSDSDDSLSSDSEMDSEDERFVDDNMDLESSPSVHSRHVGGLFMRSQNHDGGPRLETPNNDGAVSASDDCQIIDALAL